MGKHNFKIIISILSISFLIKILFFFYSGLNFNFPDTATYYQNGLNLIKTGIFTSDLHMPLYPLILALTKNSIATVYLDVFLSLLLSFLIYLLALKFTNKKEIAYFALLISAFYPFYIFFSVSKLTEILFLTLMLSGLYFLLEKKFLFSFTFLILSVYCRGTLDYYYPFIIIVLTFIFFKSYKLSLVYLVLYLILYCFLLAPWWYHNYNKYENFIRLNLSTGHLLYSGNNFLNKTGGGVGNINPAKSDVDLTVFDDIKDPIAKEKEQRRQAINYIKNNKKHFFKMSLLKFQRLWRVTPYASEYQSKYYKLISYFSYGLLLLMSFVYFVKKYFYRYKILSVIFLSMFLYLSLVHMITISSIRYRMPIEPFMIIIASICLYELFKKTEYEKKNISSS